MELVESSSEGYNSFNDETGSAALSSPGSSFEFPYYSLSPFLDNFNKSDVGDSNCTLSSIGNGSESKSNLEPVGPSLEFYISDVELVRKIKFISVILMSISCDILNCGTIAVIFRRRRIRPVNYLIANLSFTSILMSIIATLYTGDKLGIIVNLKGFYLCGILSYLRSLPVCVISFTVLAISYERIRSMKFQLCQLLIKRTLISIWVFCSIMCIPTFFLRTFVHNPPDKPICRKDSIFGMVPLTIFFEACRFTIFHASVCAYVIFELYKIRSKTKYLYIFRAIPNQKMFRKAQKIRFVYMFSISFILVWFPLGGILSMAVLQHRVASGMKISESIDFSSVLPTLGYVYLLIIPVIVLMTNEDISQLKSVFAKKEKPVAQLQEGDKGSASVNITGNPNEESETFGVTSVTVTTNENNGQTVENNTTAKTDDSDDENNLELVETLV